MKNWACIVLVFAFAGEAPAAIKRKASSKQLPSRTSTFSKKGSRRRGAATNQPPRQSAPSSDRYREIQESLAAKGYLTTPPTGIWDQNAQDALRKFQADQSLSVTGKLSSRSILALGLGAPTSTVAPQPAPAQPTPPKP